MTAPEINVHTFPYKRKWTADEVARIDAKYLELRDNLTDVVGPSGQVIYIDPSIVAMLALHLALVELGFIESRVRPDQYNMFEHFREWRVTGEFDDDDLPPDPAETEARVERLRKEMRENVDPEVLAALEDKIAAEFKGDIKKQRRRGKRVTKEGE